MFGKIAAFSIRFRWPIIILWVAAIPLLTATLPSLSSVEQNNENDFLPKNTPTQKASELEIAFQGKETIARSIIVASRKNAPLTEADNTALTQSAARVSDVNGVTNAKVIGDSKDGQAAEIFVGFNSEAFGQNATTVIDNVRTQMRKDMPSGLQMNLTGQIAQAADSQKAQEKSRSNTENYTVLLILVILFLVFRGLLAPFITLLPAGLALAASQPIIAESTKIGVDVSFLTQILLIVLILGAGTDYGLFLVFRMREELHKGLTPKEAVQRALEKVGESITFSALTVAAALLCLLFASFGLYKGLGPALAIALGVMLLAALTFLPAVLSLLGRAVFWPSKAYEKTTKLGLWGRLADRVIERPVLMLIAGVVLFTGLSLGMIGYKTSGFTNEAAPSGSDSAIGQQVIAKHFPAASYDPQDIIFVFNKPIWGDLAKLQQAQTELTKTGQFSSISSPFNANGFDLTPDQLQAMYDSGSDTGALSQYITANGLMARFNYVPKAGLPGSAAATQNIPTMRADLDKVAKDIGASEAQLYGQDASAYDISKVTNADLVKIIPIVLVVIALLLMIMLKSLVAPWYLIATVGLSYLAALGFAMLVFVHWGNHGGLNFVLPFMMFIFAMALGEDYNILVMSRIREESKKAKTIHEAVTKAIGITGNTVTSAGLILAGTFAVFGVVGGNDQLQEIGFGIAFGILLDTFFVRTLLVPSIAVLLGRWNWWPSKLSKSS
jgi:RND superfamily putative drug exporter